MEEKLSYYVVIPMPIYDDETLKDSAKLLYGLISSLINEEGYCFASNEYLAKKRKTTPQNISRLLNELEKKEYIVIIYLRDGAIIKNRKIYINSRLTEMLTAINQNVKCTVNQNVKESNKAIYSISNYIKEINKESFFENDDLNNTFKEYLQMRYEKKCKATKTTIDRLIKKLNKKDVSEAIAMLNYSIENGYQGVFELKKDKPYKQVPEEKVPDWYDKKIEIKQATIEEQEAMKEMLKYFEEEKENE